MLPPAAGAVYDPAALASYREWIGDKRLSPDVRSGNTQRWMYERLCNTMLYQQDVYQRRNKHDDLFISLHPCYWGWPGSGVYGIEPYIRAILDELKPSHLYHIVFSLLVPAFDFAWGFIDDMMRLGVEYICGSEWPEGLLTNSQRAATCGIRALLTAPTHPYKHRDTLEPWMVDAFKQSRSIFAQREVVTA